MAPFASRKPETEAAEDARGGVRLGEVVHRLRRQAGLTLSELGERCDLALSTISKVEKGQMSPTYETILHLAAGLGVDVAELFTGQSSPAVSGRRSVTRRGQGVPQKVANYDYEMLCADIARKPFIPLVTTVRAHSVAEFPELVRHPGEEFIYVLSGSVELHTEHYQPLQLSPGDSCYFDSTMGHACVSAGAEDAVMLWICSRVVPPLRG